jgi:hypothetical protein
MTDSIQLNVPAATNCFKNKPNAAVEVGVTSNPHALPGGTVVQLYFSQKIAQVITCTRSSCLALRCALILPVTFDPF